MNRSRATFTCALVAGVTFIILIYAHFGPANGPSYMRWPWYRPPNNVKVVALLLLAGAPALIAQLVRSRALAVTLLIMTAPILQLTGIALAPTPLQGLDRAEAVIVDQYATSYFTAAQVAIDQPEWLRNFDLVLRSVPMHAETKPPGPITFFMLLIRLFGNARAPFVAAVTMLLFGAASVAATYFGLRAIAGSDVAFQAATLVTLVPSMLGCYPVIDWLYPVFSVSALALWHVALTRRSTRAAIAFGLVVFVMSYWSYSLLVLGAPLAIMTLAHRARPRLVIVAAAAIVIPYAALWMLYRFDPIHTFRVAYKTQQEIMAMIDRFWVPQGKQRRYPATITGDLQEFAMGLGWIPVVLAIGWLVQRARSTPAPVRITTVAAFATPVIVALTGLLRAETSRVWIFLMPFVALPAALEIADWSRKRKIAVHATLLACAIAVYANIFFIVI